jgi:hypothetical protein
VRLRLIPPGKFVMGSPEDEKDRYKNERPHEVVLTKPFYMSVFEVTQAQFEVITRKNPSKFKGADRPVENMTWKDAIDFVIQSRVAPAGQELKSTFAHLIEGYREGETSALKQVTQVPVPEAPDTVALKVDLQDGYTDYVVYQPQPREIKLPQGLQTDARYALLRLDPQGQVAEAHMVRGNHLKFRSFEATTGGAYAGVVTDLIGDVTGTHTESAFIVKPSGPGTAGEWPLGSCLKGRPALVNIANKHDEAYAIAKVTKLPSGSRRSGGQLRVDLANYAPLSMGWYQVSRLDDKTPNRLYSNRQLWAGINTPWWRGCKAWFPEKNQTFTIATTGSDRVTMDVVEQVDRLRASTASGEDAKPVDLRSKGLAPGDWFMICGLEPGQAIRVPGDLAWQREPERAGREGKPLLCYSLHASGTANLTLPGIGGNLWQRVGDGAWSQLPVTRAAGLTKVAFAADKTDGNRVMVLPDKPQWLNLQDRNPPQFSRLVVDGQQVDLKPEVDLGRVAVPSSIIVEVADQDNPLDARSLVVSMDGKPLTKGPALSVRLESQTPRQATLQLSPAQLLADEPADKPARHSFTLEAADLSVDHRQASLTLSFRKLVPVPANTVYLSDLPEVSSFLHGGLHKDTDYFGKMISMRGEVYDKGLTTHVEVPSGGQATAHSEVIYDLSKGPGHKKLTAIIGIQDSAEGQGSVVFMVQVDRLRASAARGDDAKPVDRTGQWETVYTSPTLRGSQEPVPISVDISGAKRLRLYCTDAGDGIGSDHATWADVRLE